MIFAAVATVATAVASVQAAVLPRDGPPANCQNLTSGYLSATINGVEKSFMNVTTGTMIFGDTGADPLFVNFEVCLPYTQKQLPPAGYGPVGKFTGRLVEPASGHCVTVINTSATAPPYYPALSPCGVEKSTDLPIQGQSFAYREDGSIYWVGTTGRPGAPLQGGCPYGMLGYASDATGNPAIDESRHISLACYSWGSTGFVLSQQKD